jgi:hypothetical protein
MMSKQTNQMGQTCATEDRSYARWAAMIEGLFVLAPRDYNADAFNLIQRHVKSEPRLRAALHDLMLEFFPTGRWDDEYLNEQYETFLAAGHNGGGGVVVFVKDYLAQQVLELDSEPHGTEETPRPPVTDGRNPPAAPNGTRKRRRKATTV